MKISTKPTSMVLVGILFICIFSTPAHSLQQLNGLEQINKLREHHSEKSSELGILNVGADAIYFPWHKLQTLPVRPDFSSSLLTFPKKEEILMDGSNSRANVRDLSAINSLKQRDLIYKDSQDGGPGYQGLANSQNISVSSDGDDKSADDDANVEWQDHVIAGRELDNSGPHPAGNYLSIDVHGISVSAINTIQGGSAVATSNIIIEPVQIIICPSEVGVKLK